jgi:hypothetical protein
VIPETDLQNHSGEMFQEEGNMHMKTGVSNENDARRKGGRVLMIERGLEGRQVRKETSSRRDLILFDWRLEGRGIHSFSTFDQGWLAIEGCRLHTAKRGGYTGQANLNGIVYLFLNDRINLRQFV